MYVATFYNFVDYIKQLLNL